MHANLQAIRTFDHVMGVSPGEGNAGDAAVERKSRPVGAGPINTANILGANGDSNVAH